MTDTFIRTVTAEVKGHGKKYEESLKEREKGNPKYRFLTNPNVSYKSHRPIRVLVHVSDRGKLNN